MSQRMRILHVVPTYLPATRYGGPIYSVHGLARGLATAGCDVHVFTTNVDGPGLSDVPLGSSVVRDGVAITYFETGLGRRLYRTPDMGRALATDLPRFDVVHLHSVFLWPTTVAAAKAHRAGVPYLVAPRGMLVDALIRRKSMLAKRAWISVFEKRNLARAAAVHVTSEREAEDLRALGIATGPIVIVPNGVDLPVATSNGGFNAGGTGPDVLYLGRVSWKKGLDRLIAAMVHVPGASLVIAGNDEEGLLPRLAQQARDLGVADRVSFVGPVAGADKWRLLASSKLFVLPSHSENFGIAVLEAMAFGLPVVVSPEVGLARTVLDTGAGLVCASDPHSLGPVIVELLADPGRRSVMSANGRACAADRFSWQGIAEQMLEVYRNCIEQRPVAIGAVSTV